MGKLGRHMRNFFVVGVLLPIIACAKVSVVPVNPDGSAPTNSPVEGVRYYEPHPYLLVARLPPNTQATGGNSPQESGSSGRAAQSQTDNSTSNKAPMSAPAAPATGPSVGASDTSFSASTDQYSIRLIYLPDYSHPFAISESPGLFGSSSMKPQLQDGWMLTNLEASGDSKVAETVAAMAQLVSAAMGGGGGAAKPAAPASAARAAGGPIPVDALPPGLYKFEYNTAGDLAGLVRVTGFCSRSGKYTKAELQAALGLPRTLATSANPAIGSLVDKCAIDINSGSVQRDQDSSKYDCNACREGSAGADCRRACGD
jgi:hypothetical protein